MYRVLLLCMATSDYKIYTTTNQAWEAMLVALRNAQKSIYWEVYTLVDDSIGNRFFDILVEKSKQGIDVKLILDYWGSFGLSRKKMSELKAIGMDIRFFEDRKRRFLIWWGLFGSRTHRKVLIIDEKIGFVGGVNVERSMKNWLDIHVAIRGKMVRTLLRSFAKSYIMCGGDKKKVSDLFKYNHRVAHDTIDLITDRPDLNKSQAKKKYIEALLRARERVILFSPYYFPDRQFLAALWKAKKNGVRVDLLIPFRSDLRIASYTAYAWFSLMQRWGVKVHLMPQMMHGKGVIMDDEWAMIGSSNIDRLSFQHNHELNLRFHDKRVVRKLKRVVTRWIAHSKPFNSERWEKRGRLHKFKEWIAVKVYRVLFGPK